MYIPRTSLLHFLTTSTLKMRSGLALNIHWQRTSKPLPDLFLLSVTTQMILDCSLGIWPTVCSRSLFRIAIFMKGGQHLSNYCGPRNIVTKKTVTKRMTVKSLKTEDWRPTLLCIWLTIPLFLVIVFMLQNKLVLSYWEDQPKII